MKKYDPVIYRFIVLMVAFLMVSVAGATNIDISPQGRLGKTRRAYYNFRFSELRLAFTGNARLRWTDNIGYVDNGGSNSEDSGWSLIPSLGMDVYYPVSQYFQISAGITGGYEYYFSGEGENQFFVEGSKGSASADITAVLRLDEDSSIRFRDSWAREVDSLNIAARNRTEDYAAWRHTFSALYSKALNISTTGKVQYTHGDRWATEDEYDYLDYRKDSLDVVLLYRLLSKLRLGPYLSASKTRFTEELRNDRAIYEGGLSGVGETYFVNNINYDFNIGYQLPDIENDNDPAATDDDSRLVTKLNVSMAPGALPGHRVRIKYGRNYEDSDQGVNYVDEFLLGYGLDILVMESVMVKADIDWLDISESDNGENAELWRFTLGCSHKLNEKTSIRAEYRYTDKSSDISGNEYSQNLFEVGLSYRF